MERIKKRLQDIVNWFATEIGLLVLIWIFRFVALLLIELHIVLTMDEYSPETLAYINYTLLVFFVYVVFVGAVGLFNRIKFISRKVKFLQVFIEITLYSLIYSLTQDPRSEIYLVLFLPLLVGVRYLDLKQLTTIIVYALLCLAYAISHQVIPLTSIDFLQIYLPRALFMIGMTSFYAWGRRPSFISDLQEEKSHLLSSLKSISEGMYIIDQQNRLLFVNDILQKKYGPYDQGMLVSSYFRTSLEACGLKFTPTNGKDIEPSFGSQQAKFIAQSGGAPEQVEIKFSPLPDEYGGTIGAIGFVHNIAQQKKVEEELLDKLRKTNRRLQTLSMEREKWLDTYATMKYKLTEPKSLDELLQFIVEATREKMNAETAALFLLEDNRLMRRAITGVDKDWLAEESYDAGQGITGKVIALKPGQKYGEPIKVNKVDLDPQVISHYLVEYQMKLDSKEVKHLIAVPLNGQQKTFGVLRVVNKLSPGGKLSKGGFDEDDKDFLTWISSFVAIAIENESARLLVENIQREDELRTLFNVSQRVNQSLDPQELFEIIVHEAMSTIPGADKAVIQIIEDGNLVPKASIGLTQPGIYLPMRKDEGIAGLAVTQKSTIYIPNTSKDSRFIQRQTKIQSLISTPLVVDEDVLGVLNDPTPSQSRANDSSPH
jgi:GAF domain-containing protein